MPLIFVLPACQCSLKIGGFLSGYYCLGVRWMQVLARTLPPTTPPAALEWEAVYLSWCRMFHIFWQKFKKKKKNCTVSSLAFCGQYATDAECTSVSWHQAVAAYLSGNPVRVISNPQPFTCETKVSKHLCACFCVVCANLLRILFLMSSSFLRCLGGLCAHWGGGGGLLFCDMFLMENIFSSWSENIVTWIMHLCMTCSVYIELQYIFPFVRDSFTDN